MLDRHYEDFKEHFPRTRVQSPLHNSTRWKNQLLHQQDIRLKKNKKTKRMVRLVPFLHEQTKMNQFFKLKSIN